MKLHPPPVTVACQCGIPQDLAPVDECLIACCAGRVEIPSDSVDVPWEDARMRPASNAATEAESVRARALTFGVTLMLRACASGVFAWWLWAHAPSWEPLFHATAIYAIVDGAFGMLSAAFFRSGPQADAPPQLRAITLCDAIIRVAVGITLWTLPGVVDLPMTAVPLFGAIGVCATALGVVAMVAWAVSHHRRARPGERVRWLSYEVLFDPIAVIASLAIIAGMALAAHPPTREAPLRTIGMWGGLVLAIAFAAGAIGAMVRAGAHDQSREMP
jgi:hypothetical protein